jgi:hypothetical protein
MRKFPLVLAGVALVVAGPLIRTVVGSDVQAADWRTASSNPVGWAPAPDKYEPAVVQAYGARAWGWRGNFADHCWIAVKPAGASQYRRYEVVGFNIERTHAAIRVTDTATPDQEWYGSAPKLLQDLRGADAEKVITALPAAVESYPYPDRYTAWPGPNSNTFIAHLARAIPDLHLALPGNAIGKDYTGWHVVAAAPSGTGYQISLGGLFGVLLAGKEGFEINVLGLVIGANPLKAALTIPGTGRVPAKADWTGK